METDTMDPTTPAEAVEKVDPTIRPVQADYYGTDEQYEVLFPDGITFVTCKTMTEGDRQKYQSATNQDVKISRASGDMHMKLSTGVERMTLLTCAIIGWNVMRNGSPVPFNKGASGSELNKFILQAPPSIVDKIEREIRKHETWLTGEATIEDIDEQIENLQEMRTKKASEDLGNSL